jgi:hypothetical protein
MQNINTKNIIIGLSSLLLALILLGLFSMMKVILVKYIEFSYFAVLYMGALVFLTNKFIPTQKSSYYIALSTIYIISINNIYLSSPSIQSAIWGDLITLMIFAIGLCFVTLDKTDTSNTPDKVDTIPSYQDFKSTYLKSATLAMRALLIVNIMFVIGFCAFCNISIIIVALFVSLLYIKDIHKQISWSLNISIVYGVLSFLLLLIAPKLFNASNIGMVIEFIILGAIYVLWFFILAIKPKMIYHQISMKQESLLYIIEIGIIVGLIVILV